MFYSEEKSAEIAVPDDDRVRKSTIYRIEEITLHMIEEISSKTFPKLTYCEFIPEDTKTGRPKSHDRRSQIPNTGSAALHDFLGNRQPNRPTSFDSSKSLSWGCEDVSNVQDEPVQAIADVGVIEEEAEETDEIQSSGSSTTVDFRRKKSRKNLALIVTVMSHVHKMLINRTTKTRRSLYYELQSEPTAGLAQTQRVLDDAVNHVASLLERAPWELGFTATSKGLVFGDLVLTYSTDENPVSCRVPGGLLIPQDIFRVIRVQTTAKYVVVVEKDSIFQKLLEEDCADHLNCILITGKGYPDMNTRMLVSILGNILKIPVYVLVDADPFGIEIMCIYRFGSALRSREHKNLACPVVRWIGIHPSEYSALGISATILSTADKAKLSSLESRSYVGETENLSKELGIIKNRGKVEIEAVASLSRGFLTTVYLPRKISAKEYV